MADILSAAGEVDAGEVGRTCNNVAEQSTLCGHKVDNTRRQSCFTKCLVEHIVGKESCVRRLPKYHITLQKMHDIPGIALVLEVNSMTDKSSHKVTLLMPAGQSHHGILLIDQQYEVLLIY